MVSMWAIRQLPTSIAHWEPLEGADGATLTVTSPSLSLSLSLVLPPPPLFLSMCCFSLFLAGSIHQTGMRAAAPLSATIFHRLPSEA